MFWEIPREKGESAREYARRALVHHIVNLLLPPGAPVSEAEIGQALGISRTPVREAVLELAGRKLIDVYPQRGTFVALIDPDYVEEVRFIREVLEGGILPAACACLPDNPFFTRWEENLALQRLHLEKQNYETLLELDRTFHETLFSLAGHPIAYAMLSEMMPHFDRERKLSFEALHPARIVEDHEQIASAVQGGNLSLAQQLVQTHLSRATADQRTLQLKYPDYFR